MADAAEGASLWVLTAFIVSVHCRCSGQLAYGVLAAVCMLVVGPTRAGGDIIHQPYWWCHDALELALLLCVLAAHAGRRVLPRGCCVTAVPSGGAARSWTLWALALLPYVVAAACGEALSCEACMQLLSCLAGAVVCGRPGGAFPCLGMVGGGTAAALVGCLGGPTLGWLE